MSEYWVSQAKHYCKVCNCYIADNKASRAHHENGVKHKEKVEIQQKQKRQDKLHGARSEIELKQQLAEIEKAAKEAIAIDRTEQDGYFYQNSGVRGRPPPPPAPRPPSFAKPSQPDEEAEEQLEEDDGTGMYTVKGQTYLQGKVHEEKIRAGMECEIFVEADDEWYRGHITTRHDTPIPHTELFLVTFDVEYSIKTHDSNSEEVIKDQGIKSDRVRLLAEADGTLPGFVSPTVPPVHAVNEYTGIGMWQTVAVREVDEAAELAESERVRDLMLRGKGDEDEVKNKAKMRHAQEGEDGFEDHTDSALSAYDPYSRQRGIYKGIKLQEDANFKEQIESVAEGASVSFKKRKTSATSSTGSSSTGVGGSGGVSSGSTGGVSSTSVGVSSGGTGGSSGVEVSVKQETLNSVTSTTTDTTTSTVTDSTANSATTTNSTTNTTTNTTTAPISIKIGNMSGGAKRKFRVRAPSP